MSEKKNKPRGLGRGLSALMADVTPGETNQTHGSDRLIPIEQISPNPDQPRRRFDETDLEDLTRSIREKGVIQPLIVREIGEKQFEIVAGERRWRAAQAAQLHELPVIVREFDDAEVLEIAIIENIQRADLNPVEEAAGYRQLMDRFGHTQEKLAEALGKSRSHIANLLRLLNLPMQMCETYSKLARSQRVTRAHLITSENPSALAKRVVEQGLSVRATEALVKKPAPPQNTAKPSRRFAKEKDADTKALEGDLTATIGMRVEISHKPGEDSGQMVIRYRDLDQLDELCRLLGGM